MLRKCTVSKGGNEYPCVGHGTYCPVYRGGYSFRHRLYAQQIAHRYVRVQQRLSSRYKVLLRRKRVSWTSRS
jgi:hypothetical protein